MLLALCSDKGSPGTTTTAVALAAGWPTPAVVVEADPYGGDLGLRLRTETGGVLPETPTVLTLATAARTWTTGRIVQRYAQRINDQISVVPGHLVAEQAAGVPDWLPLATSFAGEDAPVLIDVGRLHAASPLLPVAARADLLVVVSRAETGSMIRLAERLARLVPALAAHRQEPPRLFPILVGLDRHRVADVADLRLMLEETSAAPLVVGTGHLAFDLAGVARLMAGQDPSGRLARTAVLRSARRTAADLAPLVDVRDSDLASGVAR
jgi:hypothetical protein